MAALLVGLSIMCVMLSAALPVWRTAIRREREAELIFRGEQYARAVGLFQRKYAGTFPPSVDALLEGRFLRRRYLDPITGGDFQLLYVGVPSGDGRRGGAAPSAVADGRRGILGVVSRSTEAPLRLYLGRGRYSEWMFVAPEPTPYVGTARTPLREPEDADDGDGVGGLR
jgi:type II secretory pathway pseudopilin PulG